MVSDTEANSPHPIHAWIEQTQTALRVAREMGWNEFVESYDQVLRAAHEQVGEIDARMAELVRTSDRLQPHDFLLRYVDAMSVTVDGREVFLPSFSDQCLWESLQGPSTSLSPFRGLYYSWKLSDIAYKFQRRRSVNSAFVELENLLRSCLELDFERQTTANLEYRRYEASLRNTAECSRWNDQIASVKAAIREITTPVKWDWIKSYIYPCTTSSHFYLSGVRFYHTAHLRGHTSNEFGGSDRYCVHSTDSGLADPSERYGMLLPGGAEEDVARELLKEIPPGSLLLDLSTKVPTDEDRASLQYFENWSRLVTARAYAIAAETVSLRTYRRRNDKCHPPSVYEKLARSTFLNALTKNPMRTFYFDTGICGAARLAANAGLPKIQYVTTRCTQVGRSKSHPGRQMLDSLFSQFGGGLDFYVTDGKDWKEPALATWTLVPTGSRLPQVTSCLWSVRGQKNRKITHGLEGLRRYAYARKVLDPSEVLTEGVEAGVGAAAGAIAGAAIVPSELVWGVTIGALVGAVANAGRVRAGVNEVVAEIANIPSSRDYTLVREAAGFPND